MNPVSVIIAKDIDIISEGIKDNLNHFSLDKVVDIIPHLIECVEKYKSLVGFQKKKLIIEIIKHYIDKTDGFGNDDVIDPLIKTIVPSIIDNLIKVDKNKLKLKTKKRLLSKCINSCSR